MFPICDVSEYGCAFGRRSPTVDTLSDFDRQRLESLKSEIQEDLLTLRDIDGQQAVEQDPIELRRLRQYARRTRESYDGHRMEYADLLRQVIPMQFAPGEQILIHTVMQRLDSDQLAVVHSALQEADRTPNDPAFAQLSAAVGAILPAVQQQLAATNATAANQIAQVVPILQAPTADLKQKLKLSIPLIPFILHLETELNLNIAANLKAAWGRLTQRFRPS
jgi:hypothetical protein